MTHFDLFLLGNSKTRESFSDTNPRFIDIASVSKEILTSPSSPEFSEKLTTKSLEQNIDDYYSSVDIEFEQINDLEKGNVHNTEGKVEEINEQGIIFDGYEKNTRSHGGFDDIWLKNYVQDDESQPKIAKKRSIDSYASLDEDEYGYYDEDSEENDEAKPDYTRYYRDSFFDRIAQDSREKRRKRDSPNITDNYQNRPKDITGDTVLHIRSGVSDVIKSETDLKDSLALKRFFPEDNPKSYIDDIVIHPSKFLRDDAREKRWKTPHSEAANATGETRTWSGYARYGADYMADEREGVFGGEESDEDSEAQGNDTDETLAALDSRKIIMCKLPDDVTGISWYKDGEVIIILFLIPKASEILQCTSQCNESRSRGKHFTFFFK